MAPRLLVTAAIRISASDLDQVSGGGYCLTKEGTLYKFSNHGVVITDCSRTWGNPITGAEKRRILGDYQHALSPTEYSRAMKAR